MQDSIIDHIRFASYSAVPLGSFSYMVTQYGEFTNIFKFEPHIFIKEIVQPMSGLMILPRNYIIQDTWRLYRFVRRMRRCQIEIIERVCRWYQVLRGISCDILGHYYNQHPTTVYRDFHHVSLICVETLSHSNLSPIIPGTTEYYELKGRNAFKHFPNALYACDVVKVRYVLICIC